MVFVLGAYVQVSVSKQWEKHAKLGKSIQKPVDINTLLLLILIVVVAGAAFIVLRSRKSPESGIVFLQNQLSQLSATQNEKLDRTLRELNDRLQEQNRTLNDQLVKSNSSIQQQFAISQKSMREYNESMRRLTEEVTKVNIAGKDIKDFASQLQSLENILRNPKQRGVLGEYFLETVLKNVLPPESYRMQHKFNNGEIVDALVITKDGSIPVDAKFSLENYNRLASAQSKTDREVFERAFKEDLKKRIDETSKYIRPEEGTLDFAFMFIPADGLHYDLLVQRVGTLDVNSEDLIQYSFKKRVLIVSPTTFFAYLQTVLQGLRALKIEESTKIIQVQVQKLQKHLAAYVDHYQRLGKHLGTTVTTYNIGATELKRIDKDIIGVSGGESIVVDSLDVDKPQLEIV